MRWEDATVHVTDLGWSTVGGVFEGIRGYWSATDQELYIFRLPEHMRRFAQSMKLVRFDQAYPTGELIDAIIDLVRANDHREDIYIRPMAYRGGENKGLSSFDAQAHVLINTRPDTSALPAGVAKHAGVSSWTRVSDAVMPPRIKNFSNYRNGQLATMEATINGYDLAILLDTEGKVAEGSGACVMLVRDGRLITPDVTSSVLESITRDAIITIAREDLGLDVVERRVDRTELYIADEVFFCGTAAEITPIASVDRYVVGDGTVGPVTARLAQLLHDVVRGADARHANWRTAVGLAERVSATPA